MKILSRKCVKNKLHSIKATTLFARVSNFFTVSSSAQRFIVPQQPRQAKLSPDNNNKNKSVSQKRSHPSSKRQHMEVSATNSSAFYKVQSHTDASTQQQLDTNGSVTGIPQRKTSSATHIDMASMLAASQLENTNSLSRRLTSSTEGRFTIIDEHYKESTDESFDDSDEEGSQSFDAHTPDNLRLTKSSSGYCISCTPSPFVKKLSVVSSSPNIKQMAGHGINCVGSRFKIVPVESRYKRGRWQAWDYYLDENGHYSHTNTHAPVVEDGQFRSAAVHLTGDSFVAPSRNSIPNTQTSAVSQPNPLPPKPLNPPKIAVVPPTPLPLTSSFALTTSSSATTVPVNPFSFGDVSEKPSDTVTVGTPINFPSLTTAPSKSLTDLSPNSDAPKHHLTNGTSSRTSNEDQRVPISSSTSSSPLSIIASPSAAQGNIQLYSAENAAINSVAFSSPEQTITTSSPADNYGHNSAASSQSYPSPSSSLLMPANLMTQSLLGSPGSRQQQQLASSSGRPLTPSAEMLLNQYGLERSLSATSSYNDSSMLDLNATMQQAVDERQLTHDHFNNNNSSSINGNNAVSSQNAQLVAIDSKIEQAMDLVKTHLIFAVREEVELLRSKILELETTVIQLEAENSILREHVPAEILQNLTLQPGANTVSSSTMMTAQ